MKFSRIVLGASCVLLLPIEILAQDDGGRRATATWSNEIRDDDDGTVISSGLSFGLSSQTRTRSLLLSGGFGIEAGEGSGDLDQPNLAFSYGIQNKSTALNFSLGLRQRDVDSSFFQADDQLITNVELVEDDGERQDRNAALGLEFGRDGPVQLDVDAGIREVRFFDTLSPELFDTEGTNLSALARFRIRPDMFLIAGVDHQDFDTFGQGADRQATGLQLGVLLSRDEDFELSATLHFDTVDIVDASGARTNEGAGLSVTGSRTLGDGRIWFDFTSREFDSGRRSTVNVGRELDLKNGDLSFSVGLRDGEDSTQGILYGFDYNTALSDVTQLSAGFDQTLGSDVDAQEIVSSTGQLSIQHMLAKDKSITSAITVFDVNTLGVDDDSTRFSATFGYTQALARDWDLNAQIQWRETQRASAADDSETTISIGVSRTFDWRP